MPLETEPVDEKIKTLAISLQRQKTAMEASGLQEGLWDTYWKLSEAIWSLELATGISAPTLRDLEDEQSPRRSTG